MAVTGSHCLPEEKRLFLRWFLTMRGIGSYICRKFENTWKTNGDLTSPESLEMLRNEGITHVYIGERGGQLIQRIY